jgi:hypothetical protein
MQGLQAATRLLPCSAVQPWGDGEIDKRGPGRAMMPEVRYEVAAVHCLFRVAFGGDLTRRSVAHETVTNNR